MFKKSNVLQMISGAKNTMIISSLSIQSIDKKGQYLLAEWQADQRPFGLKISWIAHHLDIF